MNRDLKDIANRLRKYVNHKGTTIQALEESSLVSKGLIHRFMRGDGVFSIDKLVKIANGCPELNIDWLINGRGEMTYDKEAPRESDKDNQIAFLNELLRSKDETIEALKRSLDYAYPKKQNNT